MIFLSKISLFTSLVITVFLSSCGSEKQMGNYNLQSNDLASNVYLIDSSTEFDIGNSGSRDYLFSWSVDGSDFDRISDPTLVLSSGKTYLFKRTSSRHPFRITSSQLRVRGRDGNYSRTTRSASLIDSVSLKPLDDFTASGSDVISWTPTQGDIGQYYYTCVVSAHQRMTGSIIVR